MTSASCFFNTETSGQSDSGGYGTAKNTAEMKDYDTFNDAGWSIEVKGVWTDETWKIWDGLGYPQLAREDFKGFVEPNSNTGSVESITERSKSIETRSPQSITGSFISGVTALGNKFRTVKSNTLEALSNTSREFKTVRDIISNSLGVVSSSLKTLSKETRNIISNSEKVLSNSLRYIGKFRETTSTVNETISKVLRQAKTTLHTESHTLNINSLVERAKSKTTTTAKSITGTVSSNASNLINLLINTTSHAENIISGTFRSKKVNKLITSTTNTINSLTERAKSLTTVHAKSITETINSLTERKAKVTAHAKSNTATIISKVSFGIIKLTVKLKSVSGTVQSNAERIIGKFRETTSHTNKVLSNSIRNIKNILETKSITSSITSNVLALNKKVRNTTSNTINFISGVGKTFALNRTPASYSETINSITDRAKALTTSKAKSITQPFESRVTALNKKFRNTLSTTSEAVSNILRTKNLTRRITSNTITVLSKVQRLEAKITAKAKSITNNITSSSLTQFNLNRLTKSHTQTANSLNIMIYRFVLNAKSHANNIISQVERAKSITTSKAKTTTRIINSSVIRYIGKFRETKSIMANSLSGTLTNLKLHNTIKSHTNDITSGTLQNFKTIARTTTKDIISGVTALNKKFRNIKSITGTFESKVTALNSKVRKVISHTEETLSGVLKTFTVLRKPTSNTIKFNSSVLRAKIVNLFNPKSHTGIIISGITALNKKVRNITSHTEKVLSGVLRTFTKVRRPTSGTGHAISVMRRITSETKSPASITGIIFSKPRTKFLTNTTSHIIEVFSRAVYKMKVNTYSNTRIITSNIRKHFTKIRNITSNTTTTLSVNRRIINKTRNTLSITKNFISRAKSLVKDFPEIFRQQVERFVSRPIELFRGEQVTLRLTLYDDSGEPRYLDDAEVYFNVGDQLPLNHKLIESKGTKTYVEDGEVRFYLTAEDTDLKPGLYYYNIQVHYEDYTDYNAGTGRILIKKVLV